MSLPRELAAALADPELASGRRDELSTRLMGLYRSTGNREAYAWLFRLNSVPLGRSLERRLPRLAPDLDPDDVVQDAFLSVYLYPRRFEDRGARAFRTWMRAIVGNAIRRRLRRQRRGAIRYDGEAVEAALDPRPAPPARAARFEELRLAGRAFALLLVLYLEAYESLRARDRERLRLVEVEGLRYRDAAGLLGEKRENFKMNILRARRRIFRAIERRLAKVSVPCPNGVDS